VDDLSREVYCILGLPIDAIDLPGVLRSINFASRNSSPLFLSTPNLNYLINSHTNPEFRESLLLSDLCPADGAPIVWLGRLLGAPIKRRVAGSDILAAAKTIRTSEQRLKLFLFGGAEGVAAAASRAFNAARDGVVCVLSVNDRIASWTDVLPNCRFNSDTVGYETTDSEITVWMPRQTHSRRCTTLEA
jgi:N-acetylglucosaminyldiphosphoundecaprenol N-acetyl-beta-D-mannosaminyltransferase